MMGITERTRTWCDNEVSELEHFSVADIRERSDPCEKVCTIFGLHREEKGMIPTSLVIGVRRESGIAIAQYGR